MIIRNAADIAALEGQGFDTVFPLRTPWDILRDRAQTDPERVAMQYLHDAADPARDETVTFGVLAARAMAAARVFRGLGVGPGQAVALLTQHTPMAQTALWGAQGAGIACPINPMLKPDHVAALLEAAGAQVVVITGVNAEIDTWTGLVPALRAAGVRLPILACDADADSPGADGVLEDLIAAHLSGPDILPEGGEEAIAAYYHTGGTTGAPKLVRHTRRNEAHVARCCAMMHDLGPQDVVVNGFPLFHVAGAFVYGLSSISAGSRLVIPGRLGMRNTAFTGTIWQQVERLGITCIGAVPTILAALNAVPVNADITTLRAFLTGGSPLPSELADATERHSGKPVRNILGMTESAGAIAVEPVHAPRTPLSCGLPLPFCEVAILGETDGTSDPAKPLPVGETGIVALRGPNVAAGYTDPARNAGTFLPGGWLASGDLGRLDAQGRLYVTGRKKDVIIRGAHNIDPQMIEDALQAHPQVATAAAVGMPDAYAGELPVAFVTLRAGADVDGAALIAFLRGRIDDPVALPKRIGVLDSLPLTPVGKVFKPGLRREATVWAIHAAARDLGAGEVDVEFPDTQEVIVTVPAPIMDALKARLAGMPVTIHFRARATA